MQRVLDGNVERNIRNDFDKILVKGFYDRILKKKILIEIQNFVNVSRNIIFKKTGSEELKMISMNSLIGRIIGKRLNFLVFSFIYIITLIIWIYMM